MNRRTLECSYEYVLHEVVAVPLAHEALGERAHPLDLFQEATRLSESLQVGVDRSKSCPASSDQKNERHSFAKSLSGFRAIATPRIDRVASRSPVTQK